MRCVQAIALRRRLKCLSPFLQSSLKNIAVTCGPAGRYGRPLSSQYFLKAREILAVAFQGFGIELSTFNFRSQLITKGLR